MSFISSNVSNSYGNQPKVLDFFHPRTLLVLLAGVFAFSIFGIQHLSSPRASSVLICLAIVQLMPFALAVARRSFNYLVFVFIAQFVVVTISKVEYLVNVNPLAENNPYWLMALEQYVACDLIIIAAFHCIRFFIFRVNPKDQKPLVLTLSARTQFLMCATLIASTWILNKYIEIPGDLGFKVMDILVVLIWTSRLEKKWGMHWVSRVSSFAYGILNFLMIGMLGSLLSICICVVISAFVEGRYFRLLLVSLAVLLGLEIQSIKNSYRALIWIDPNVQLNDRLGTIYDLVSEKWTEDKSLSSMASIAEEGGGSVWMPGMDAPVYMPNQDDAEVSRLLKSFRRVSDDSLERVLEYTPSQVPFWNGETYETLLYMFIPRVFWPDKPSRNFWNKYGRKYGVLLENDLQTSVAISYLAEGYMNFGFAGMYVIAIFMGLMIASVEYSSRFLLGGTASFSFIVCLLPFMSIESDFGSILQTLLIHAAMLSCFYFLVTRRNLRDEYST